MKARNLMQCFKKGYRYKKQSYSQSGEDLIVKFIFDELKIKNPSYIDIGAHHPYYINNTALFYENGSRGVNIEPDPSLYKPFLSDRKNDINLNIGIGKVQGVAPFYIMSSPTLNTFSHSEAVNFGKEGDYTIKSVCNLPVQTIGNVIEQYCQRKFPDFLSLDAEGIDEIVLKSIDFSQTYPLVICVETLSFSSTGKGIKNKEIIDFLEKNGYLCYADTYINTIFVRKDRWVR